MYVEPEHPRNTETDDLDTMTFQILITRPTAVKTEEESPRCPQLRMDRRSSVVGRDGLARALSYAHVPRSSSSNPPTGQGVSSGTRRTLRYACRGQRERERERERDAGGGGGRQRQRGWRKGERWEGRGERHGLRRGVGEGRNGGGGVRKVGEGGRTKRSRERGGGGREIGERGGGGEKGDEQTQRPRERGWEGGGREMEGEKRGQ